MKSLWDLMTPFVLVIIFVVNQISANVQSIQLCYTNDCSDSEVIRSSVRDINQITSKGKMVAQLCALESAWTLFEKTDFEGHGRDLTGNRICQSAGKILSFRHQGNVETHKAGLSLYDNADYEGQELYFEGDTLQLPEPFSAESDCFTGIDRWELYQGQQYNGKSKCLQIREDTSYEFPTCQRGSDSSQGLPEVNSIGRGCHHDTARAKPLVHPSNPLREKGNKVSAPFLTLFTQTEKLGKKLYMDGNVLRLPKSFNFQSTKFKGTWQVFSGVNFDGNSTCLDRKSQLYWSDTEGGFSHGNDDLEVGSVKRGCGHPINDSEDDEDDDDVSGATAVNKSWIGLVTVFLVAFLQRQ